MPSPKLTSHKVRSFTGAALHQIAMPIGGIGTGTVSIGGRGHLTDLEIYNRPWKGNTPRNTFFALWFRQRGKPAVTKVLEREFLPPFTDLMGGGFEQNHAAGAPRMREAIFIGEYPFARIELRDPDVPLRVELETFNPFIPLNDDDSSIPCILLKWRFTNTGNKAVEASFLTAFSNPINRLKLGEDGWQSSINGYDPGGSTNSVHASANLRGIAMANPSIDPASEFAGTAYVGLVGTDEQPAPAADLQTRWYQGGWWDGLQMLWNDFSDDGRVEERLDAFAAPAGRFNECTLCAPFTLKPGESREFTVLFTWHLPNVRNYWNPGESVHNAMLRNWYATRWNDAQEVAQYVADHLDRLDAETRRWHDTFFNSTLPSAVLDAASSQASIMRTTTCLRLDDGRLYAFEGCHCAGGCCPMNCSHVWNYEQSLAFLFPGLERSMRLTDFIHNTNADGKMVFRTLLPLSSDAFWSFEAAADGQMGTILKAYREWQLSGDDEFLRALWPGVKRTLEYAWHNANPHAWDRDKDGVMEGRQHNTYDIEYFGPNSMMGALYLGALRAASLMAQYLGESDKAAEYQSLYESGRSRLESMLWNGEYYVQKIQVADLLIVPESLQSPLDPFPKYQYGPGCLSDQLLGQWLSHAVGIGHVLDPRHTKRAMQSVYKYNWRAGLRHIANMQRVYALNDEAGLAIVTWPKGGRPQLPSVYADEVWTGIEYQVAAGLIYEGEVDAGLSIVEGVRARHDGVRRNPWNEFECGNHYARAMSSWSLVLALSGYHYSAPEQRIGFAPKVNAANFRCFWSTGSGWGEYAQRATASSLKATLRVAHGELTLRQVDLGATSKGAVKLQYATQLSADAEQPDVDVKQTRGVTAILFSAPITLRAGDELEITARSA
ncbi:MAG: non-lysosomal glucosylceramidase [Chloroflexi bacterium]|nr:non-lysosomal glucosylceramidase [Chloroflexota bacterium]